MVFPHPFPHLWKTCSKPIFSCYLREYESQRIPCKYWKGKSGKAEFCSCGKHFRIRKNTTFFSSFHKGISLWKSLKSKKNPYIAEKPKKKEDFSPFEGAFPFLFPIYSTFFPSVFPFSRMQKSLVFLGKTDFSTDSPAPTSSTTKYI